MTTPLQALVEDLSLPERQEFQDAITYLAEHSNHGMPEGSVARVINGLSPAVRQKFELVSEMLETPRLMPFQPKMGNDEYAEAFGADPRSLERIKQRMDAGEVATGLQRKMGTDASLAYGAQSTPLTLKEQLAAALDLHGGK